jgi:uncharacterized protein YdaU (DUF1376 family)
MADLTRFDFHAKKFYFSEDVQVMSAEEVGQYLLLLVAAWLGGKDTSLPDNAMLLARLARVNKVSDIVLAKFPVVETEYGLRRRNDTLYGEWQAANLRVQNGKDYANKRWSSANSDNSTIPSVNTYGTPLAPHEHPTGTLIPRPYQPRPDQAVPTQARVEPSQVRPSQAAQPEENSTDASALGLAAPDPAQAVDFKMFRHEWQNITKLSLGRDKRTIARYEELCGTYGAGRVHYAVKRWATENTLAWMKEHAIREPFSLFAKQLEKTIERMSDDKTCDPEMLDAAVAVERVPDVIISSEVLRTVDDVVSRLAADEQKRRIERAARAKAVLHEESSAIIDVDNFLS